MFIYAVIPVAIIFQANFLAFVHSYLCVWGGKSWGQELERAGLGRWPKPLDLITPSLRWHAQESNWLCKKNRPFHLTWPAGYRGRVKERDSVKVRARVRERHNRGKGARHFLHKPGYLYWNPHSHSYGPMISATHKMWMQSRIQKNGIYIVTQDLMEFGKFWMHKSKVGLYNSSRGNTE